MASSVQRMLLIASLPPLLGVFLAAGQCQDKGKGKGVLLTVCGIWSNTLFSPEADAVQTHNTDSSTVMSGEA